MGDEAQQVGKTMAEVGRAMLASLDAWDEIPRGKWRWAANIPKFYKQGDYRLEPKDLPGVTDAKKGKQWQTQRNNRRE